MLGLGLDLTKPAIYNRPAFNLDAYLASIGASYYDFTRTDDQFQEATGPTPANVIGNPIGLKLDRGLWRGKTLAEVVAGATNLTPPGGWQMSVAGGTSTATESPAGSLNLTGDGTNQARGDYIFATVGGAIYALQFKIVGPNTTVNVGPTQASGAWLTGSALPAGTYTYYFVATGTTGWIRFGRSGTLASVISDIAIKLIPGIPATQSSSSLKSTWQTTGAKFDGTDDNLLTSLLAGSGANFIVALVSVPGAISAFQYIAGTGETSATKRFGIGINTNGKVGFGVGSTSPTTANGTSDVRGATLVLGFSSDGSNVLGFMDATVEYSAPLSGSLTTNIPLRIGAYNDNNVITVNPFAGSIKRLAVGKDFLTLSHYLQIRHALLAA